jgi:hypothetical protein
MSASEKVAKHPRLVYRVQGTWASFVVMRTHAGKFAVEQYFDHGDSFAHHQTFTDEARAKALADQLARHS